MLARTDAAARVSVNTMSARPAGKSVCVRLNGVRTHFAHVYEYTATSKLSVINLASCQGHDVPYVQQRKTEKNENLPSQEFD